MDLLDFLAECKKRFKLEKLRISTNGKKLLDMPDSFFELARNIQLIIDFTIYPKESGIPYNEIIKRMNDEQIFIANKSWEIESSMDSVATHFDKFMLKDSEEPANRYPNEHPFALCVRRCPSLWQGKLYKCANLPFIDTLNDNFCTRFKTTEGTDYLKVKKIKDFKSIHDFITSPGTFCKTFCTHLKFVSLEPWQTGTNTKDEILY